MGKALSRQLLAVSQSERGWFSRCELEIVLSAVFDPVILLWLKAES
jgi:hypothetical protein